MFKWLHNRCDTQLETILQLHRELEARQDKIILDLREDLINAKAKISLMETILLPLSSNAGASYQQLVNPPKRQAVTRLEMPYANEWQRFKLQKEKELEQSYNSEEKSNAVSIPA